MDKNKREAFFLFKFGKGDLKKDERKGVSKLFLSFIIVFVAIDIGMLVFYQKTKKRMEDMIDHPYTTVIRSNIEESSAEHERFAEATKQTIKTHHDQLRQLLDNLGFNTRELGRVEVSKLEGLEKLQLVLAEVAAEPGNEAGWKKAESAIAVVSSSMEKLSQSIKPLNDFMVYNEKLDTGLRGVLDEIKGNLDGFLFKLLNLANQRNQDQDNLYKQMQSTLTDFGTIYGGIVKDNKYVKLNNFYSAKPISYDKNYVPFTIEFDDKYFGAKLTVDSDFKLALPRVYFCNLRAYLISDGEFDVKLQYVDSSHRGEVLFESTNIKGGSKDPASFDEYFTFNLDDTHHALYLRVVSLGSSTKLNIEKLKLSCLSYRNFVK